MPNEPKTDAKENIGAQVPPPPKRYCVTYLERARVEKPKALGRQHSFFTAVDQADAENQFWRSPIWKPPVKKIEIVSIEPV